MQAAARNSSEVQRRPRRWIPWLGAALLLALIIAGLWPKPLPVETSRVEIGPLRVTVSEEGKTRIKQRYVVSAPVAGQLRRIPYKAGHAIASGEIIAVIDPISPALLDVRTRATTEAKRDAASANVEKARAAHEFAASELRRFEKLWAEKTISAQELESVQLREAAANRDKLAAEGALREAEAELKEFDEEPVTGTNTDRVPTPKELRAPVSGRVLRVFQESARVVSVGTPLAEVGDPSDLEVVVEVLSRDGAAISPGAKVEFEQWGGGRPLSGRVRFVEPAAFMKVSALGVEEQRVNVVADILAPPEQRPTLGDNFRVEARIVVWEESAALKVPAGALFRRGEQWSCFVVQGGRAHLRAVKVGKSSGTEMQVLEGLKLGEEVVIYPGNRIEPASRVRSIKL